MPQAGRHTIARPDHLALLAYKVATISVKYYRTSSFHELYSVITHDTVVQEKLL